MDTAREYSQKKSFAISDSDRVYVSIVGHQFMAALNPLLALLQPDRNGEISAEWQSGSIVLLATAGKSMKIARKLAEILGDSFKNKIRILPISTSLAAQPGHKPVQEMVLDVVKENSEAEVYFNIAGGIGFQSAASALALYGQRVKYLYPELSSVHLYVPEGGVLKRQEILPVRPLKIKKLLDFQGIEVSQSAGPGLLPVLSAPLEELGLTLPENVELNLKLNGIFFNVVSNYANTLRLLKVMEDVSTQEVREFMETVITRKGFGELFHYRIMVLTNRETTAERLRTESLGKIEVVQYRKGGVFNELLKIKINNFFVPGPGGGQEEKKICLQKTGDGVGTNLYAFLGRSVMPTLKAIWSHQAEKTYLFYTDDDERVNFFKNKLLVNQHKVPSQLEFIPLSFHARELEEFSPLPGPELAVNVTPGTKSQGFFLARMAARHNGDIYSLDKGNLSPLSGCSKKKVVAPSVDDYLSIAVDSRKVEVKTPADKKRFRQSMKALLILFKRIKEGKGRIADFFGEQANFGGVSLRREANGFTVTSHNRRFYYRTRPNEWFEQLVGYVVTENFDDAEVRIGVKTYWQVGSGSGSVQGRKHFRSEGDVYAKTGSRYYMISCKAGKNMQVSQKVIAREVKSVAAALDRMVIPLLAILKYSGKPKQVEGVYVFGYKTLIDNEAFKALFAEAAKAVSSTSS